MALAQLDTIREVFERVRDSANHGDAELLTRYRTMRDQEAFSSLVRRHGPMVLGVCRRVLRDSHAAEDAFQATFIVLAKKADAVRPPERLAPWLYGVAYRTALKARGRTFRRQQVEQTYAVEVSNRPAAVIDETPDLAPIIDEQLSALPEKYRTPLILCALQGLNKAEAAEKLGLPEGTVSSRLARGREMLRDRLARRGVVVPLVAIGTLFTANTLQAAVPPALAATATEVAAGSAAIPATILHLSHEVLRSMTLLKLKSLCAVALCLTLSGGGFGVYTLTADEKKPQQQTEKPTTKPGEKSNPNEKNGQNNQKGKNEPNGPNNQKGKNEPNGNNNQNGKNEPNGNNNQNGAQNKPNPGGEKPGKVAKFGGKVASVNAKENTLSIIVKGEGGLAEVVVKVTPDAKVFIDGEKAQLADVPKNSSATLLLAERSKDKPLIATEVRISGSSITALIKEVDATSITLASEKKPRTITLAARGEVIIDGKKAKLADLKPGDKVTVTLTADESAAMSIVAGSKGDDEKGKKPTKPGKFAGKVVSTDSTARTIAIAGKVEGQEIILKLTADAKIIVDGKEAKLSEIQKGMFAMFTPTATKGEVSEVFVSGPALGGSIKQIDATTITVGTKKGDCVIKLLATTKVTIDGKDAKLDDLKTGDHVTIALTSDETSAVSIAGGNKVGGDKTKPGGGQPKPGDKPKPESGQPKPDNEEDQ